MEHQVESGRRLVLLVIVISLTFSVLVIVTFNILLGPENLPQQIVRFLLTVGLCAFLYKGANWARWVASILFGLAGLQGLIGGLVALSTSTAGLLLIVMGLVYVASAIVLLFIPAVRAYFGVGNTDAA